MPKVKIMVDRASMNKKNQKLEDMLDIFSEEFLQGAAGVLIVNSPVDTGTYITSHKISTGRIPVGVTSSRRKPRRQSFAVKSQEGINRLFADIASIPEETSRIYIGNMAAHANVVEQERAVYAILKRESERLAKEAGTKAKARV